MKRFLLMMGVSALCAFQVFAGEDPLAQWAKTYDTPQTQQAILNRIFSGQVGPLSNGLLDKSTGIYLFPKNDSWVRLGQQKVYVPAAEGGPYLVVSCMFYNKPERGPITATSYIFFDTNSRPETISSGYAGQESVQDIKLQKIGRRFLVLVDRFGQGNTEQWSASVLAVMASGRPREMWKSPVSARRFQFGFDLLGGRAESLVFKSIKSGDIQFSVYRWTGDRFELDSFPSGSRLKALSQDVWQFGAEL